MATKINETETVTLQDGSEVEIRPLNIKNLRKFMDITMKFGDAEDDLAGLDLMVEAVQVAIAQVDPEKAKDRDYLEENLDMPTITKIMAVAGGVDISGEGNPPVATA